MFRRACTYFAKHLVQNLTFRCVGNDVIVFGRRIFTAKPQVTVCSSTQLQVNMDKFVVRTPRSPSAGDGQSRKMTREAVSNSEKEKYLNMSLEEKRKLYKCRSKYVKLEEVQTWPQIYRRLLATSNRAGKPKAEVNDRLNEKVSLWRGDITTLEIDAISNAANNSLLGGGGVDGAIHAAAGSSLRSECAKLDGCDTGDAKITGGYKLPAKYIIHTVGPRGENSAKLKACYLKCLKLLKENKGRSLAFPCISTGIYGYPNESAAHIALKTVRDWLEIHGDEVDRVIFCLFLGVDVKIYEHLMSVYFPVGESVAEEQSAGALGAAAGSGESKESGTTEEKENQEIAEKKTELTEDPSVKS